MRRGIGILMVLLAVWSGAAGEEMYIRVVSRENTAAAQAEKFRVARAVRGLIPARQEDLPRALEAIEEAADGVAPCRAEIRPWAPAGGEERDTLYITVGEGKGPNWWGILYRDGAGFCAKEAEGEETGIVFPWIRWLLALIGW